MHFLTICLLTFGVSGLARASSEESWDGEDFSTFSTEDYEYSQESSIEDFQDAEEDFEEYLDDIEEYPGDIEEYPDDLEEYPIDEYYNAFEEYPIDEPDAALDTEDLAELDAFRQDLGEAFRTWNAAVKSCTGDRVCLAKVNNVVRPMVNQAADKGVIGVIDPCEDRVGTYELETVDGWVIEAVLPC